MTAETGVADPLEATELLGLFVILVGYLPIVLSYVRHRTTWAFAAYTTIFLSLVAEILAGIVQITAFSIGARVLGLVAGVLFAAMAYLSRETIDELQAEAEGVFP